MKRAKATGLLLGIVVLAHGLAGCGAVVVGGAVATATVAHDRRTTGSFIEDQNILLKGIELRNDIPGLVEKSNISIDVFNMQVLMTGQAENAAIVETYRARLAEIPRVRNVFNEVEIGAEATWSDATADAFLTSKVKLALFDVDIDGFDPTRVEVTSSQGSVFLMGLVTRQEADAATDRVRFVSGVKRVVKLFEYIEP